MPDGMNLVPGGPDGSRTHDFYNANVALSQLSYGPVYKVIIYPFYFVVKQNIFVYSKYFLAYPVNMCYNRSNFVQTDIFV